MRQLPSGSIYSRDEALGLGWSDAALSRATAAGRIVRVRRGFYCATAPDEISTAMAAARATAGSAVGGLPSLLARRLPVVGASRPVRPDLTVAPNGTGDTRGVQLRRAAMPRGHVTRIGGVAFLTVARTLVDVARHSPMITSVPAFDAALYRGLVTADEVDDVVRFCWNWPGMRRAHRAIRLVDGRAESPLESISRLTIARLGLPQPDLQPTIFDQYGRVIGRLDFYWDEFGVAGEADGRSKYDGDDGRAVLMAEKERQELLEDAGLTVVRWGWEQAMRRPQLLGARIEAAFSRGTARDRTGLPRLWSVVPS